MLVFNFLLIKINKDLLSFERNKKWLFIQLNIAFQII